MPPPKASQPQFGTTPNQALTFVLEGPGGRITRRVVGLPNQLRHDNCVPINWADLKNRVPSFPVRPSGASGLPDSYAAGENWKYHHGDQLWWRARLRTGGDGGGHTRNDWEWAYLGEEDLRVYAGEWPSRGSVMK